MYPLIIIALDESKKIKRPFGFICVELIGNRQIKAHSITHAVEIPCLWICTQLRSCDLSLSYDNEPTQLRTKLMLANTISSFSNVFFLCAAQ